MSTGLATVVHFVADDLAPSCDARLRHTDFSGTGSQSDVTCSDCIVQLAHKHRGPVNRGPEFSR